MLFLPQVDQSYLRNCLLICFCCINFFGFAQLAEKSRLADSLYAKAGVYTEAALVYENIAKGFEERGLLDSAFHKYLYAIKAMGQANQIVEAITLCEVVLEKMNLSAPNHFYQADIFFEKGYCELVIGDREACIQSLKQGIEKENNKTSPDSLKLAGMIQYQGLALLQSGETKRGKGMVVQAYEIKKHLLEEDHFDLASSANMVYMAYDHLFEYGNANKYIAEAHRILSKQLPSTHPHIAIILNNWSNVRRNLGDPYEAKELLLKAIAANQEAGRGYLLAMNYYNLADLYFEIEAFELADTYFSKSLELGDSILVNPSLEKANLYDGLGKIAFHFNRFDEAATFFQQSLAQNLQIVGPTSVEAAQSFHNLGLIAKTNGLNTQASDYFNKSIQLRKDLLGTDHPLTTESQMELANSLWALQEKEPALALWKKCLQQFENYLGENNHRVAALANQLAAAYRKENVPDSVAYYMKIAWNSIIESGEPKNDWIDLVQMPLGLYHANTFDVIEERLNDLLKEASNDSMFAFQQTEAIIRQFHLFLPKIIPLLNQQQTGNQLAFRLQRIFSMAALIAHRSSPQKDITPFYLSCLENSKAFSIRVQLQKRNALSFSKIPDSLQIKDRYLQSRIWAINALKEKEGQLKKDLVQQEIKVNNEWNQWQQTLATQFPSYFKLQYQKPDIDLVQIAEDLSHQDQSLLAYFLLDSLCLAITYDGDHLQSKELKTTTASFDSLLIFNQLIASRAPPERVAPLGFYLYQQFFQPIEYQLKEKVLLFPDGPLYYLNFDLLLNNLPDGQLDFQQFPWLIHKYDFHYANHLKNIPTHQIDNGKNIALAPGFSPQLKEQYLEKLTTGEAVDSTFLNWLSTPWSVALLNELEQENWGETLIGPIATKSKFLPLSKEANIIHFATHAFINNENPLRSFLALNPAPNQKDDGYLYASDLYGLDLNNLLVVLSACQTGLGDYQQGEGVISLAHGFQYAGCPSMIYSLWSIDDQQTNWMIKDFYQFLTEGKPISEALRQSKLTYLREHEGRLSHPYYWGGLVLLGQNQPIYHNSFGKYFWLYLIGFLVVMGLVAFLVKKI